MNNEGACRIKVGSTVIEIQCPARGLAERFKRYFRSPVEESDTSTIAVFLDTDANGKRRRIPDSLFIGKSVEKGFFTMGGGVLRGDYVSGKMDVKLRVDARLLSGRLVRIFEQFLYQAFYSDPVNRSRNSFLIHASGVIHNGKGFVFTGPSGSGKSTIAKLSAENPVLNDEICLVTFEGGRVWVSYTPFNGFFKKKTESRAPLNAVFLISHGKKHSILRMDHAKASTALLQQIVPPIGIDEAISGDTISRIFDLAESLQKKVPVYGLAFTRDAGFWNEIDRVCGVDR